MKWTSSTQLRMEIIGLNKGENIYHSISEDMGLSERYVSRIVEILDIMDIIKYKEGKCNAI